MLMFILELHNSLPHYLPKGTPIVFNCTLGETITKSIDLKNHSNKPISYWVKYIGSPDFSLPENETIKIEANSSHSFKVKFISRVSQSVKGRLTLTNKKETNVIASALVFDLVSEIKGRISKLVIPIAASLYEVKEFSIPLQYEF